MLTSLTFDKWPVADQAAWSAACAPKQGIRRGGRAAHLKPITRRDLERRYGYFLTYLDHKGELDASATVLGAAPESGPSSRPGSSKLRCVRLCA